MNPSDAVPDSILRHRPFVFYWSARTCAAMGYQMLGVAVSWQMYALTGSAFDLGMVGLTQFLPMAAFMLVAGQVADRYDRRRLLQICQALEGLAAAALAIGSVSGWVTREFILAAVFVFGVGRAFEAPTQQTLLPAVVPVSLFPRAVAARPPSLRPSPARRSAAFSTPSGRPFPTRPAARYSFYRWSCWPSCASNASCRVAPP